MLVVLAVHAIPAVRFGAATDDDLWRWSATLNVIEWIVPALAGLLLWWRARSEASTGWRLVSLGVVAWTLGQVYWWVAEDLVGWTTSPSPADIGFLLLPGFVIAGVLLLGPLSAESSATRWVVVTEALLLAVAASFLLWVGVLADRFHEEDAGLLAEVLLALYPLLGVAVAATAALLLYTNRSPALAAVAVGAALIGGADLVLALDPDIDELGTLLVSHGLWVAGFTSLGVAALLRHDPTAVERRRLALHRALLVYGPLSIAIASAIVVLPDDRDVHVLTIALAASAAVLLLANQVALWRESDLLHGGLVFNVGELERVSGDLRTLLDSLAEAVVVVDRSGTLLDANERVNLLYGRSREELIGHRLDELVPEASRDRLMQEWAVLVSGGIEMSRPQFDLTRPDGTTVVIEVDARPIVEQGTNVVLSLRDVTDRRRAEDAQLAAELRFRLAFESAPSGTALLDAATASMLAVNDTLSQLLRRDRDDLVGSDLARHVHPDDLDELRRWLEQVEGAHVDRFTLRHRMVRSDGALRWCSTSVARLDALEHAQLLIAHLLDISDEVTAAERLAWSATHDEVTGLANRAHFLDVLRRELQFDPHPPLAVLFLDLDRFKLVNDSLGHAVGDDLLRSMAGRLRDSVRPGDLVARFGGDEFTVMLRGADEPTATEVAARIRRGLSAPVTLAGGTEVDVTASVGLAVAAQGRTVTAEELIRDADTAMYRAKDQGRDRVVAFTPETRHESVQALLGRNELRMGIDRDEIVPYFQPIVELSSGRLVGYEAVARWNHPERGLLVPDVFLPIAEERGLIGALGAQILRSSLAQLARWLEANPRGSRLTVAVNVSARQLVDPHFVGVVREALAESGVDADHLWLELTETALMTDVRSATGSLRELRNLGLHLSVDDFGTGYSSLTYLKRFPVEAIKIDRAFVGGLGIDPDDSAIVEAVIRLGSSLGLTVVAEGVESPLQLARLRELGCDRAQGYLFGRPRPPEMLDALPEHL